ncbi:MAG: AbrB/MazE/SpoVT family DNA-binding domain-containing protein [Chthoniobacterales bacterium]
MNASTLTERGQVSIPAALRKGMNMRPGQRLLWEQLSERELRVTIEPDHVAGPMAMLGYARRLRNAPPRSTADWMQELRAGE